MQIELRQRLNKFRERLRRQKIQGILKHRREQILEYKEQELTQVVSLLQQLPNASVLIQLAKLLDSGVQQHPMLCQTFVKHLKLLQVAFSDVTRERLEEEGQEKHQQEQACINQFKALMAILAAAAGQYPEKAEPLLELITEELLAKLTKLGQYDLVFPLVRSLNFLIPSSLLELLELFIGNRSYWGRQQLSFLTDAIEYEAEHQPNGVSCKIKQMYFNQQTLSVIIDNITSHPYSENSDLASRLLFLFQVISYYDEQLTQRLVQCKILGRLKFYVMHSYPEQRLICLHIFSNLCVSDELRESVNEAGLVGLFLDTQETASMLYSGIVMFICNYAAQLRNQREADSFLSLGGLSFLINVFDMEYIEDKRLLIDKVILALRNMFQIGEELITETTLANPYLSAFEALGGINRLERFANCQSVEVFMDQVLESNPR